MIRLALLILAACSLRAFANYEEEFDKFKNSLEMNQTKEDLGVKFFDHLSDSLRIKLALKHQELSEKGLDWKDAGLETNLTPEEQTEMQEAFQKALTDIFSKMMAIEDITKPAEGEKQRNKKKRDKKKKTPKMYYDAREEL